MQSLANFFRLQHRHRLFECGGLEIQEERHSDRLQLANPIRRFHGRTSQHALAPRLFLQIICKGRREFLELIDIFWLAAQRERQFARLFKIAIVSF